MQSWAILQLSEDLTGYGWENNKQTKLTNE